MYHNIRECASTPYVGMARILHRRNTLHLGSYLIRERTISPKILHTETSSDFAHTAKTFLVHTLLRFKNIRTSKIALFIWVLRFGRCKYRYRLDFCTNLYSTMVMLHETAGRGGGEIQVYPK